MMGILDPALLLAATLTLAFIFGSASASKLLEMDVFRGVLHDYRLLPDRMVGAVAWFLPIAEAVGALSVLWGPTRVEAGVLLMVLTLVFTAAVVVNLRRGRTYIDCGCFRSSSRQPIGWRLVLRNLVLLVIAAVCLFQPAERSLVWIDLVGAVATALALTLMYIAVPYTDLRLPALRAVPDPSDAIDTQG